MRFKAAYTVEAAFVIPIFTIVVVALIQLMLLLHDRAVYTSVMVKINMQEEFSGENFEKEAEEYLKKRLILDGVEIDGGNVQIQKNNMAEYIRISKALLKGGE